MTDADRLLLRVLLKGPSERPDALEVEELEHARALAEQGLVTVETVKRGRSGPGHTPVTLTYAIPTLRADAERDALIADLRSRP